MAKELEDEAIEVNMSWQDLEDVLAEIATLSKSDISYEEFARQLLSRSVQLLAAIGGSIWRVCPDGTRQLVCQIRDPTRCTIDPGFRRRTFDKVIDRGEVEVVSPAPCNGDAAGHTQPPLVLVGPLKIDQDVAGLLEIVQRPTDDAAAARGNHRYVSLACELASDHLRRQELRELRRAKLGSSGFDSFIRRIHATIDLPSVAYELVNEGRQYIGCDRVGLAVRHRRSFRLIAMSGIARVEHRSNAVRRLEQLVARVGSSRQSLWYDGENIELPHQIGDPLQAYIDEANVRMMGLVPLSVGPRDAAAEPAAATAAVLIFEHFTSTFDKSMRARAEAVASHGRLAIINALRYQSLPTLPFVRQRQLSIGKHWFGVRGAFVAILTVCAVAALFLIPADFSVYAEGKLQPTQQQDVFAPLDGQVVDLAVRHADHVAAGDKLLELTSPQLDIELQQIQGDYETARKRLLTVESALLQSNVPTDRDDDRAAQLAAEHEELIKLLESQQKKLQLLQGEVQKLVVRSPIAGQVLTWDLEPLLKNRPVQRGQAMMSIANLKGPWIAEVEIPDDRVGYVVEAQSAARQPLGATFRLATEHRSEHRGTVREVATRTNLNDGDRSVVNVKLDFDESLVKELRPGATVYARIQCGRRALGYVWLHDLIEAIRAWLLF